MMTHDGNKGGGLEHLWKGKRLYCFKCGHQWISRSETRPDVCPKCHIRRYDIPPDKYTCKSCEPNGNQDVWMTPVLNAVMRPQKERPQENIHAINAVIWTLSVEHIPCH